MKKRNQNKINSGLIGASGEFLVAHELSKRGVIVTLTIKNTPKIDILATNPETGAFANIQVKTRSAENKQGWKLTKKVETKTKIKNHYYVFVNLKGSLELPDFYIIPYNEFADVISKNYKKWLKMKGKDGQPHKDNDIRNFKPEKEHLPLYKDDVLLGKKYKSKWEVLGIL
ncbi:MAG: aspartate-ammonia lyase [Candidatus Paceibacterota bacterium]